MKRISFLLLFSLLITGCADNYQPKPRGYYRIDTPEKSYKSYTADCPVSFEIPKYSRVEIIAGHQTDTCWLNISYPRFKAKLHCTYLAIDNNLDTYLNESYAFAFKHESKANAIKRTPFHYPESRTSGLMYDLEGSVATAIQFYATDSTEHFFRGSLYFNVHPNPDSLAPVLAFLREDIEQLIRTLTWVDEN
jgi:gliding motility-associated lipoprotein GldD